MSIDLPYALDGRRIWVAGEHGMAGSAITRRLACENCEIIHLTRRAIDFREGDKLDKTALKALFRAAVAANQAGAKKP